MQFANFKDKIIQEYKNLGIPNVDGAAYGFSSLFNSYREDYLKNNYAYNDKIINAAVKFEIPSGVSPLFTISLLNASKSENGENKGFLLSAAQGSINDNGIKSKIKVSLKEIQTSEFGSIAIDFKTHTKKGIFLISPVLLLEKTVIISPLWGAVSKIKRNPNEIIFACSISNERPDFDDALVSIKWDKPDVTVSFV